MPTVQGEIRVRENLKGGEVLYLTVGHPQCKTSRTFVLAETVKEILQKKSEGIFIETPCDECGKVVRVELFRGRPIPTGWSYMGFQEDGEVLVEDFAPMLKPGSEGQHRNL